MRLRIFLLLILFGLLLAGCAAPAGQNTSGKLAVVATTTIVGDVVQNVGGEYIDLVVLIAPGTDEHGYQPTPQDAVKVAQARLVFMNGAGLEQFIEKLVQNAAGQGELVSVSKGIPLLKGPALEGETQSAGDPHVWTDPNNVLVWVDNIEKALSAADPRHSADYQKRADAYRQQLRDLDSWVREQTGQVPAERRKLVTDHLIFTYFAKRYSFEQVGAVVPGYSSAAAPSAQELAALENAIQRQGVPVIFVGNTVNPALSERVTQDTHTKLVHILTGSLSEKNGPGATYLEYMKYDVGQLVEALK
jgi:manganese/iron transport system substrate-binding protein